MDETIILNVHIKAASGKGPELREHLSALLEPSREEPGCLQYLLHTDPEDPDKLMFYEAFANQKALDEHLAAPYFQAFLNYREESTPDPMESAIVTRWRPVTA
jgi:quinol monooxygenase YgiN